MKAVDEYEDEEEVVVLGCGLRCHAGRCGFLGRGGLHRGHCGQAGGCPGAAVWGRVAGGGLAVTWRPSGPILSAAVGEGGAGLRSPPSGLGLAQLLQCVRVCGLVSGGGEQFVWAAFGGRGGTGLEFQGGVRGVCAGHWAGWVCRGVCGSSLRVCAGCRVWGMVRAARREGLWRASVVVWAGGGGPFRGARGCTRWWACVGRQVGSGEGGAGVGVALGVWGWVPVCGVGVWARLQRRACVVTCRLGGLEEKLALFCGRGKDFADECAYLVHLLVGGGKRVLQWWANVHAAEDPVDGVVSAGEVVLWPGGRVRPRGGACLDLCVGAGDGADPGHGPCGWLAALDPLGQAEHGQSQVAARPPRFDSGQSAGWGFVLRLEDAAEDFLRGGGVPYCPWAGGPWGKHGVGPFDERLWAGGRCRGGYYVVVPALEDCTRDLQPGSDAVCRKGEEVVVGFADAGGAEGGVAGWCGGLFPLFWLVWVCSVVLLRWGSS